MTDRNPAFHTFRRKEQADPHPGALTDEEREHIAERLRAGSNPRYNVIRKAVRLADDRLVKLQRIERLCTQVRAYPMRYQAIDVATFIQDILKGDRL
jgi:hypothetical protein